MWQVVRYIYAFADCNLAVLRDHWGFKALNLTNPPWKAWLVWGWSGGLLGSPFLKKNFYGLYPGWLHEINLICETFRPVWQVRRASSAHLSDVCVCSNTPDLNNPKFIQGTFTQNWNFTLFFFLNHSLYPPWTNPLNSLCGSSRESEFETCLIKRGRRIHHLAAVEHCLQFLFRHLCKMSEQGKFLEKRLLIATNVLLSITPCPILYVLAPTLNLGLKTKDIYRHNTYIYTHMYIINLANVPIHPLGN